MLITSNNESSFAGHLAELSGHEERDGLFKRDRKGSMVLFDLSDSPHISGFSQRSLKAHMLFHSNIPRIPPTAIAVFSLSLIS